MRYVAAFSFLILCSGIARSENNRITILDNFSSVYAPTLPGATKGTFMSKSPDATILVQKEGGDLNNNFITMAYNINPKDSYCGLVYEFTTPIDLNKYGYMSFYLKKQSSRQLLRIQFITLMDTVYLASDDFTGTPHLTDAWIRVCLPLQNVTIKKDKVKKIVFVIENTIFSFNKAPLVGDMAMRDLIFGSGDPKYIVIDRFTDLLGENSTGGVSGAFTSDANTPGAYSLALADSGYATLNYDNSSTWFGGAFFLMKKPVVNNFDTLCLEAWSPSTLLNPGTIKLEIKKNNNQKGTFYLQGITTTRKNFKIPVKNFIGALPDSVAEFTIVMEKNVQDKISGKLFIDNILLIKKGYVPPGSLTPSFTVTQKSDKKENDDLFADAGITIKPENQAVELAESVELIAESPGSNPVTQLKTFSSGFQEYNLSFPTSVQVLSNSTLKIQLTLLNGSSRCHSFRFFPFGLERVLRDATAYIESARNEKGMYRDALTTYHPASTAACGIGILAQTIASGLGYITEEEAVQKIETTLKTMLGRNNPKPPRNQAGYFYHWFDMNTLQPAWNSEYSTIDQAILMATGMLAANAFGKQSLKALVYELFMTTDFSVAIEPVQKRIYREINQDGNPVQNTLSNLFNEYFLVLEMSQLQEKLYEKLGKKPAAQNILGMWNFFSNVNNFPTKTYLNYPLLTDQDGFISNFVCQTVLLLSEKYSHSDPYKQFVQNAYLADSVFFKNGGSSYFGLAAGVLPDATYQATNLGNNQHLIYTPAAMAGYLPGIKSYQKIHITDQLLQMIYAGKYTIFGNNLVLLPRRSADPQFSQWVAPEHALIDYFPMMMGLAFLFNENIFSGYMDFEELIVKAPEIPIQNENDLLIYPNPATKQLTIRVNNPDIRLLKFLNETGQLIRSVIVESDSVRVNLDYHGMVIVQGITDSNQLKSTKTVFLQ